jgi:3-oxoacyl-[acyl-carrier protein] reductase
MAIRLDGKVALVTAASEGLGFACAKRLAEAGSAVAICARRENLLAAARQALANAGGGEVLAVPADIADADAVKRLMEKVVLAFGRLDVLVLNTGHIDYGGLEELDDDQWRHAFDLLLMSAVRLTRHCIPIMRANGGGDIVLLGSATMREPPPHLLLSTVMRLGVAGLAKTLARSLAPENIRVNLVAPGYFDAGRVHKRVRAIMQERGASLTEASAEVSGGVPMGRLGEPQELAELVAFLVSRKAGFMTGSILTIDGGAGRALF